MFVYLFRDPAVFSCCAALLVEESVEVYGFNTAAAPVLVPEWINIVIKKSVNFRQGVLVL